MVTPTSNPGLITVSSAEEGASDWTSIAALPNGGFVAVWHDGGGKDGSQAGVYGRILDENYQRVGEEFLVNTLTNGFQTKARVATLSDGTFMVVWAGGDGSYQGQIFAPDATKSGSQFTVGPWFIGESDIIGSSDDKFLVLKSQNNQNAGVLSVYSRTGEELVDSVIVTSSGGGESRVIELSSDRYLVAWYDAQDVEGFDIHAQIFDGTGTLIGDEFILNSTIENNQQAPELVATGDGGFAAVWQSYGSAGDLFDIYLKIFDANGTAVSDEILVNTSTEQQQTKPSIAIAGDGTFVVTWQSDHLGASQIMYQSIAADGTPIGDNIVLSQNDAGDLVNGNEVALSTLSNGAIAAAWDQAANIYAKIIDLNIEPELIWSTNRSTAYTVKSDLNIKLFSNFPSITQDLPDLANSIPGNAILDLRKKSLSISDIPLVTPAVIPQMYVFVSEKIVNLTDQKDLSIKVAYNEPVTDHQLILMVDGAVVEFTSDKIELSEDPSLHLVEDETTYFNITMASDLIDNLFSNSANTIELGYADSILVRISKLDADDYLISKTYTGDYSQTISAQTFKDAQYNSVTYTGDAWTASVVIGADDADTIKLSNQNIAAFTGSGDDTIILDGNGTYVSGLAALNISSSLQTGTEELINLNGKTRFEGVMDGGADVDTIGLTNASDAFFLHDSFSGFHSYVTLANDYEGREGAARIENIENINAGDGDDIVDLTSPDYSLAGQNITVNGGEGHDTLWGSDADETLNGGNGDDVLFGGAGTNTLTGGAGADEFQFTKTSKDDTISDFNITEGDTLAFFNTGGAEFDTASMVLTGESLQINYSAEDSITILLQGSNFTIEGISDAIFVV